MDEQKREEEVSEQPIKPAGKYLRVKPFALIMLLFLTILLTAGLTIFALTFGEKKVVEVKVPVEREEFTRLYDAFDELKDKYYVDVDEDKMISGAINGMFDALDDPYTDYMNTDEANHFNESLSSSFQGIGAEIQERNGDIVVVSPIKNSPAEKAGIMPQDIILTVDGKSIQGMTASEAVLLIRGEKGTSVTLTVKRGDAEPTEMTIVRDDIPIETVYGEMGDDKIAHIQITSFSEETYKELLKILTELDGKGMKGIVLDVRQNPGGFLDAAIDIANLFLEDGKPILQVQGRDEKPQVFAAEGEKKFKQPVTILIDEGSASASEILAAALLESADAEVIGVPSFGKGTVQTVSYLEDGSNLKFTTGKWLTPKGNWINEKGVTPTIEVKYPSYASLTYVNPETELKTGMNDKMIQSAEGMLEALGYDPGEVDGVFDGDTEDAVKAFQKAEKLEQTGTIAGDTTYALMDALREKIEKEDPMLLKAKEVLTGKSE
ncbi:S41 family peptidase [Lysinibacillus odysseyi]|uniref:Peptidase S41 n=1 Tax=Lysinibacillus odysseyi 34hs-1 = NBRC 100172 TaxID=1220589 RepID=A0A0A3IEG0_9BACI|nr:S41 family peptidase [Lysinibacillus odysseyi]KGR81820.1 peptidase S41 [Lysinibacillus odysseyi 34hs-1 = NBRC 100172]